MKFNINDSEWQIVEVDGSDIRLANDDGTFRIGVAYLREKEIVVNASLKGCQKRRTLIHELTHAFLVDCLISSKEQYDEEEVCEFVAIYSAAIIKIADEYMSKTTCPS